MKVLTVTNQKGGVGKTALACHLAFAAVEAGKRTLLVDLDTQANASVTLTGDPSLATRDSGSAVLFTGERPEPVQTETGIAVLHGHQHLDALDTRYDLQSALPARHRLRELPYEVAIIDTPPAIGLRHVGPILWCDFCLTPMEPAGYSIAGLAHTLHTLRFARRLNPGLRSRAIINRYIRRSSRHAYYLAQLSRHVELARPYLTLRVAVPDALDAGVPVWRFPRAARETREQWRSLCEGLVQ